MNNYQNKLDYIASYLYNNHKYKSSDEQENMGECLATMQELVDRAKPMKVNITTQERLAICKVCGFQGIPIIKWYDSKTDSLTSVDIRINFCPNCGQKLDWEGK